MKIGHVGLCVPDLPAAISWYQKVFDLELLDGPRELTIAVRKEVLQDVFGSSFERAEIAHLGFDGEVGVEMFQFILPPTDELPPPSYFRVGFSHLCFVCEKLEETVERILQSGGTISTSIWTEYPGLPYRFVHFKDPFGNLLELHSHPYRQTVTAGRTS